MNVLHPALLAAGFAALAIPIAIHLLMHRRRKPVRWGAMRFLLEAYRRQRRRLMLEKWVLLACRCLVLALLALAIARPMTSAGGALGGGRTVYVLVDNGLASTARTSDGTLALDRHKRTARAVLDATRSAGDRVALIALGNPAEGVVMPPSAAQGAVAAAIDALEPTDARTDLAGALALVSKALDAETIAGTGSGAERTSVVVVSDFAEGSLESGEQGETVGGVRLPAGVRLIVTPPTELPGNVAITDVEPLRSVLVGGGGARSGAGTAAATEDALVRVQLRRSGPAVEQSGQTTVRVRLTEASGQAAASGPARASASASSSGERGTVRWSAGQETAVVVVSLGLERSAGGSGVIVAQIDDDAIAGDNRSARGVELRPALRVGVVAPARFGRLERADRLDPGAWARLALQPAGEASGIEVVDIEPASVDAARLVGLDALVIARPDLVSQASWERLGLFVEAGGMIVLAPPPGQTVHTWTDAAVRGLGVDWSPERESVTVSGRRLVRGAGANADARSGEPGLLSLVESELGDLLASVSVRRVLPIRASAETGRSLLELAPGASGEATLPVVWARERTGASGQRGLIVWMGVSLDLEASDLPAKPLMVPLMQELVRQGVGRARGTFRGLAGTRPVAPDRAVELVPIVEDARTGEVRTLAVEPGTGARRTIEPARRAGVYRAIDDLGGQRGVVVVNADWRGGRTGASTRDAVAAALGPALVGSKSGASEGPQRRVEWLALDARGNAGVESATAGTGPGAGAGAASGSGSRGALFGSESDARSIAMPLLFAALGLVLIEVLLARRASHAEVGA